MTAVHLPEDAPYFAEWRSRRAGERRDLGRARLLAHALGIDFVALPPTLLVVGSKGKGTAVAWASAALAPHRVVSVTSPPFRTNRERIRLDGAALDPRAWTQLAGEVEAARQSLPPPAAGYLSPTGAFTIAGLHVAATARAEVLVLEEGLGGLSDEVSLVRADVVGVTRIFPEHVGVIGETLEEIAADLLGVIRPGVRAVVSVHQDGIVAELLEEACRAAGASLVVLEEPTRPTAVAVQAMNAALGRHAAAELERFAFGQVSTGSTPTPWLPGRLQQLCHGEVPWVIDAAISPEGVARARAFAEQALGGAALVLACFPTTKDADGCFGALDGLEVVPVTAGEEYLSFGVPSGLPTPVPAHEALERAAAAKRPVFCVGTISFVAEVLEFLDVATDAWW